MSADDRSIHRVVVGIDGSEGSAEALRWAAGLALTAGAEVVAVHVVEPATYDVRPLGLPRTILNEADWREAIQDELEETWCRSLIESGVRHRVRIEEGHPGPRIAGVAEQERADLVVAGRRGLGAVAELIQGSVSAYLTHHAPCPVAVIPAARRAA